MRQRRPRCFLVLIVYVLILALYNATFTDMVRGAVTTYYPSSANVSIGSYVSGDMASLVNVDTGYYVVRSAGSATTTVAYNPGAYNLLGSTSLVSGTMSDLASDNSVYMTFRSYASQPSTTSPSKATIGYRSNTGTYTLSSPKTRSWSGSAWDGSETELATAGSAVRWVRSAYCPLMARYYEKIIVTVSDDGYLDAYVWTGGSWSATNNIGYVGTTANAYLSFDVAYEKTSGKAMLVYGIESTDPGKDLAYRVWDGTAWSGESYINDTGHTSDVQYNWVRLAAKPTNGANEIALGAVEMTTTAKSARAWIWSGTSWGNELALDDDVKYMLQDIDVAYESLSGNAMFTWYDDSAWAYQSRRWLGSSWEGTERSIISFASDHAGYISLKPDPSSNRIMFLVVSEAYDLYTADWNPTTWTTHSVHDTLVDYSSTRCADGDWEPTGSKYLMVRGTESGYVRWKTWTPASGWSTATSVTASGTHNWIQLRMNPRSVSGDVKILGAMLNSNNQLGALKWDGTTLTNIGDSTFTASTTVTTYECFDLRFQALGDPIEFTCEAEFTGSSNSYGWAQLLWTIDSAWTDASVVVTIQLYNYTGAFYPSSGDGCISYTSSATPNTDETKTQTIATNPQVFRDASGNWKIKIKGVKATSTQFNFKADLVEYKPTHFTEYTASTEFLFTGIPGSAPTLLVFTVVSQYDIGSVAVAIQAWSYNTSQYPTSGEGYLAYISSAAPSTDDTINLAITTNPSHFLSSGNAKLKVTAVKATTTQLQQRANQVKLDKHSAETTTLTTTATATQSVTTTATATQTTSTTIPTTTTATVTSNNTLTTTATTTQSVTTTATQTTSTTIPTTFTVQRSTTATITVPTTQTIMGLQHITHTTVLISWETTVTTSIIQKNTFVTTSVPVTVSVLSSVHITETRNSIITVTKNTVMTTTVATVPSTTATGPFTLLPTTLEGFGFLIVILVIVLSLAMIGVASTAGARAKLRRPLGTSPFVTTAQVLYPTPTFCTSCGAQRPPAGIFCTKCGKRLYW